jgi:hypothetical protein
MAEIVAKRLSAPPVTQQKADTFAYDRLACAVPPYDLDALAKTYEEDPDVYLCCNAIAAKACGAGWELQGEPGDLAAAQATGKTHGKRRLSSHSTRMRCPLYSPSMGVNSNQPGPSAYLGSCLAGSNAGMPSGKYW